MIRSIHRAKEEVLHLVRGLRWEELEKGDESNGEGETGVP